MWNRKNSKSSLLPGLVAAEVARAALDMSTRAAAVPFGITSRLFLLRISQAM